MSLAVDTSPAPPWFEDLPVGTVFGEAPSLTLTEGHAALHQAVVGDRLRVALDRTLGEAVLGAGAPVAHPGLVWDTAIGQSTVATGRVVANLFYRGLLLRRAVRLGDTLHTTTEVVARRENRVRAGRRPTGLALLRIRTADQAQRPVLDFTRCAMLPLRDDPTGEPGDEVGGAADLDAEPLRAAAAGLDLAAYRSAVPGPHFDAMPDGWAAEIEGGDVVDSAPALARLTLNAAMAHLDAGSTADGRRLVYGGHAIGLAAGQAARALPALVTILGWHACEHTAPVFEGDTLRSRLALERREPLPGGGGLLHLRSRVTAARAHGGEDADVLDWRFVAVLA
jgi:acyl dehydratase